MLATKPEVASFLKESPLRKQVQNVKTQVDALQSSCLSLDKITKGAEWQGWSPSIIEAIGAAELDLVPTGELGSSLKEVATLLSSWTDLKQNTESTWKSQCQKSTSGSYPSTQELMSQFNCTATKRDSLQKEFLAVTKSNEDLSKNEREAADLLGALCKVRQQQIQSMEIIPQYIEHLVDYHENALAILKNAKKQAKALSTNLQQALNDNEQETEIATAWLKELDMQLQKEHEKETSMSPSYFTPVHMEIDDDTEEEDMPPPPPLDTQTPSRLFCPSPHNENNVVRPSPKKSLPQSATGVFKLTADTLNTYNKLEGPCDPMEMAEANTRRSLWEIHLSPKRPAGSLSEIVERVECPGPVPTCRMSTASIDSNDISTILRKESHDPPTITKRESKLRSASQQLPNPLPAIAEAEGSEASSEEGIEIEPIRFEEASMDQQSEQEEQNENYRPNTNVASLRRASERDEGSPFRKQRISVCQANPAPSFQPRSHGSGSTNNSGKKSVAPAEQRIEKLQQLHRASIQQSLENERQVETQRKMQEAIAKAKRAQEEQQRILQEQKAALEQQRLEIEREQKEIEAETLRVQQEEQRKQEEEEERKQKDLALQKEKEEKMRQHILKNQPKQNSTSSVASSTGSRGSRGGRRMSASKEVPAAPALPQKPNTLAKSAPPSAAVSNIQSRRRASSDAGGYKTTPLNANLMKGSGSSSSTSSASKNQAQSSRPVQRSRTTSDASALHKNRQKFLSPVPNQNAGLYSMENMHGIAVAKFSFEARQPDELSFQKGDSLAITHKGSKNWWHGIHTKTQKQGIIPAAYVKWRSSAV